VRKGYDQRWNLVNTGPHVRLWEGLSERERLEMRKERAIRESREEAQRVARARRWRRIRSLTTAQVAFIAAALIFALLLALVAID
jgi:hypothetical protein